MSVVTVDGADGDMRCSEVGHYCCSVGFSCTAYQNVADTVGNIDLLSNVECGDRW
jgi:hypothetical protein